MGRMPSVESCCALTTQPSARPNPQSDLEGALTVATRYGMAAVTERCLTYLLAPSRAWLLEPSAPGGVLRWLALAHSLGLPRLQAHLTAEVQRQLPALATEPSLRADALGFAAAALGRPALLQLLRAALDGAAAALLARGCGASSPPASPHGRAWLARGGSGASCEDEGCDVDRTLALLLGGPQAAGAPREGGRLQGPVAQPPWQAVGWAGGGEIRLPQQRRRLELGQRRSNYKPVRRADEDNGDNADEDIGDDADEDIGDDADEALSWSNDSQPCAPAAWEGPACGGAAGRVRALPVGMRKRPRETGRAGPSGPRATLPRWKRAPMPAPQRSAAGGQGTTFPNFDSMWDLIHGPVNPQ
jgi:hypothetical protein